MAKTFMYFAYGSNLLTQRLHIHNPSAVKKGYGKLKDYRLDFNNYSKDWGGAPATIVPTSGAHTWGAIYELDMVHRASLDKQEGVHRNLYFPMEVDIEGADGVTTKCRVYQQVKNPPLCEDITKLPDDRKPSAIYFNTIKKGAIESKLPENYRMFLDLIPDNGYTGNVDFKIYK